MKFCCKKRHCPGVLLRGAPCSSCGLSLTVGCVFKSSLKSFRSLLRRRLALACPGCKGTIPAFDSKCKKCGTILTVERSISAVFGSTEAVKPGVVPSATKQRLFQWGLLGVSALIFWLSLQELEHTYSQNWQKHAALTIAYFAAFLLLSLWIVPQKTLIVVAQRASKVVKLALVFNYLTGMILIQMFVATWWLRSLMLASILGVTWAGAWIFARFLWPLSATVSALFIPPGAYFDPTSTQGRNVRYD